MAALDFIHVTHAEPHASRGRQILAQHPELRALAGAQPLTALWVVDDLQAHRSWTAVLVAFLRDRRITLFSRVVRPLH